MKKIISLFLAAMLAGCASVSYGPLSVRSVGTDLAVDSATWIKSYTNGTSEALTVVGGKRNSSESVHTVANVSMAILGALIGSPAGIPGSAIGAASGTGLAEAWQTLQDWLNKSKPAADTNTPPVIVPTPDPVQSSCGCSEEKMDYSGAKETIVNGLDGHNDVRCLANWTRPDGAATWLNEEQVRQSVHFDGNTMTVKCIPVDGGTLHYTGFCQPSSKSDLVTGNPVTVGSGTLRCVYEAREAK